MACTERPDGNPQQRCHAHVWAAGGGAWIKGVRWPGDGPHLALSVHTGDFPGYGLDGVSEYAGTAANASEDIRELRARCDGRPVTGPARRE